MKRIMLTLCIAFGGISMVNAQTQAPAENKNQAEINFTKEIHDFGVIPQNEPATYMFYFTNTGKEPNPYHLKKQDILRLHIMLLQ
jgi:archaellum component FlaG (FlaF/FlaG flagellin family)